MLEKRRGLLDGVVFSGGEPTLQQGLKTALEEVRRMGFKTALHTGGPYPDRLKKLLPLLNWVGLDIKALSDDYPQITGVPGSGEPAWESARLLIDSVVQYELRITVHPAWLSADAADTVVEKLQAMGVEHIVLQAGQLRNLEDPELNSLPPLIAADYLPIVQRHAGLSMRQ